MKLITAIIFIFGTSLVHANEQKCKLNENDILLKGISYMSYAYATDEYLNQGNITGDFEKDFGYFISKGFSISLYPNCIYKVSTKSCMSIEVTIDGNTGKVFQNKTDFDYCISDPYGD